MITLYLSLFIMLIFALAIITIPFVKNFNFFSYFFLSSFIIVFSFSCYQITGDKTALFQWINQGEEHYQLLTQFDRLGGLDVIIQKIEAKLEKNPHDNTGWKLLSKLYMSKHEDEKAKEALQHIQ